MSGVPRSTAHFATQQREKPTLWNGRVLLGRKPVFDRARFCASYFETDFASFLAWRDWGFPDKDVFNGFGMGALRCADGAFVMGEMAGHTANGGRVYFPSGTPDLDDIDGGAVDIEGSVAREVAEETGLTPADYQADAHWDCVVTGVVGRHDQDIACQHFRRGAADKDRGQSRPAIAARTLGDPSGAGGVATSPRRCRASSPRSSSEFDAQAFRRASKRAIQKLR